MPKMVKKIGSFILWVLTTFCVVVIIGNLWMMFQTTVLHSKAPSILGYSPLIVNTGSMAGEANDNFNAGDLVIIHKTKETLNLKKGTIITFVDPQSETKALVTHRIHQVITQGEDHIYETKGDANNTPDKGVVNPSEIIGVYQTHFKGFGSKLVFLQSPKGMLLFIVLPLVLLFGSDYDWRKLKRKSNSAQVKKSEQDQGETVSVSRSKRRQSNDEPLSRRKRHQSAALPVAKRDQDQSVASSAIKKRKNTSSDTRVGQISKESNKKKKTRTKSNTTSISKNNAKATRRGK